MDLLFFQTTLGAVDEAYSRFEPVKINFFKFCERDMEKGGSRSMEDGVPLVGSIVFVDGCGGGPVLE